MKNFKFLRLATVLLASVIFIAGCVKQPGDNNNGDGGKTKDTAPPVISLLNMPSEMEKGGYITVGFTVTDDISAADKIYTEVKIFDADNTNKTEICYNQAEKTFTTDDIGVYTIRIQAYDEAGNKAEAQHSIEVFNKLIEDNPLRLSLAGTTDRSYQTVNTKFYYNAYVSGDTGAKPLVEFRLLRGNAYEYASEVAGGVDESAQTFSTRHQGKHFLEVRAAYGGYSITDYTEIQINALSQRLSLYSFEWDNIAGFDYSVLTVGKNLLNIDRPAGGETPEFYYAISGGIWGGYSISYEMSVSGEPWDFTSWVRADVVTGGEAARADGFYISAADRVAVTNFRENGFDDYKAHTDYGITADLEEKNAVMIKRDGKNYTFSLNGDTAAERRADTVESALNGIRFSAADAGFYVEGISVESVEDTPEPIPEYTLPLQPTFGNAVTVHDPSVFKDDDGRYYAFGSHFATAVSEDLTSWTQYSNDGGASLLYAGDWKSVLAGAVAHVPGGTSTWAPDVIKLNGKYYMYYSLSTFGSSKSYIGRVEASSPTGPYTNSVEIIKSFGIGGEPNAIDPALFFDNEGRLWMSYGSFFAGIYIIELYSDGQDIGLPKESGYGTKLWGGGGFGPEGPYIFYNADTDYYYLMVSHGSLSTNYNMRVARSKNPNGPYTDITGRDMAQYGNAGNKLAGNYQFSGYSAGYAAMGHNSVLTENGKYYVVYHTRYKSGSGVSGHHNLQVNQLLFNEAGWPVLAPNRYAGESLGKVTAETGAGTYDVLIHTEVGNSAEFATSTEYVLGADGSIKQGASVVGSWQIKGNYYADITVGGVTYRGVILPQWNAAKNRAGLSITATSGSGVSLWANAK